MLEMAGYPQHLTLDARTAIRGPRQLVFEIKEIL